MTAHTLIQNEQRRDRTTLLRRALQADAVFVTISGLAALLGAGQMESLFGIPAGYLQPLGIFLLAFAVFLGVVATRQTINRRLAWAVVILGAIWVVDSLILLVSGLLPLTPAGWWFTLIQALIVADFAIVEYVGLRRAR
jgi:hypothetical protein